MGGSEYADTVLKIRNWFYIAMLVLLFLLLLLLLWRPSLKSLRLRDTGMKFDRDVLHVSFWESNFQFSVNVWHQHSVQPGSAFPLHRSDIIQIKSQPKVMQRHPPFHTPLLQICYFTIIIWFYDVAAISYAVRLLWDVKPIYAPYIYHTRCHF